MATNDASKMLTVKLKHNGVGKEISFALSTTQKNAMRAINKELKLGKGVNIISIKQPCGDGAINLSAERVSSMGFVHGCAYNVEIGAAKNKDNGGADSGKTKSRQEDKGAAASRNKNKGKDRKAKTTANRLMKSTIEMNDTVNKVLKNIKLKKKAQEKKKSHKRSGEQKHNGRKPKWQKSCGVGRRLGSDNFDDEIDDLMKVNGASSELDIDINPEDSSALQRLYMNKDCQDQRLTEKFLKNFKRGGYKSFLSNEMTFADINEYCRLLHVCLQNGTYAIKKSEHTHVLNGVDSNYAVFDLTMEPPRGTSDLFYHNKPYTYKGMLLLRDKAAMKEWLLNLHEDCSRGGDWKIFDVRELPVEETWSIIYIANMTKVDSEPASSSFMVGDRKSIANTFREMLEIVLPSPPNSVSQWEQVPPPPGDDKWVGTKRFDLGEGY